MYFGHLSRRAALATMGAGVVAAAAYVLRGLVESPRSAVRLADGGSMMGVRGTDMARYMEMFNRHTELRRTVDDIPGGVRTTTESDAPDLVAQLHAHVPSMYGHLSAGAEVSCMSQSLPTLFRRAGDYQRHITLTPTGVVATETSSDPDVTAAIRAHAQEVTGFVNDGMPAMMGPMMGGGGMMGGGSMTGPH